MSNLGLISEKFPKISRKNDGMNKALERVYEENHKQQTIAE